MNRKQTLAAFAAGLAVILNVLGPVPTAEAKSKDGTHRIFLVTWRGCEFACKGFQEYFKAENLSVDILHRDAGRDKTRLPGFAAEAKRMSVDLVVTWGTSTALGILGTYDGADPALHVTKIPAMFMIVSQPLAVNLVPNLKSSGRNITGTLYLVPEETQLNVARAYRPFKKMAVIYNSAEKNSVISVSRLRKLAKKQGWTLIERPVPKGSDGKPDAGALPALIAEVAKEKPQWFYQGPDSFLNVNRDVFTSEALKNGIPVFTAGENPVRTSNALLGVVNRYYNIGQFTAYRAQQVLMHGKRPIDMPIESPSRFSIIVNLKAAKALGIYPPMPLLKVSEVITGKE